MKKVINGKRYNTESAQYCGSREYGYQGDLDYVYEALYQKRTGEFFLYGEGGARSKYAEETSINSWSGGESIIPLSDDEAKEWAEKYLDGDDYEKIFTIEEPEENGKKIQSFSLSGDVIAKLTRLSREHKTPRSQIIEELVRKAE